ncbi:MAG: glycosyltransferase family 4 protein [Patescibacteria group bacterium]
MKILLFSSTNDVTNGYGNITHELCSRLTKEHEIKLLLPKKEPKYPHTVYPTEYVLPDYIYSFKTPKILSYALFNYQTGADIIHSLFEFPYALLAAKIAKKNKKPFIIGTQGTYAIKPLFMWPEKYWVKKAYNQANVITAPSQFTKDSIINYSGTKTPIRIIHNGVNFARFHKKYDVGEFKNKFGDKKILLTVGQLRPRKGQDVVIQSLAVLKRKRNDFHYLIVGEGTFLNFLKGLVSKNGLDENVSFMGSVKGEILVKYFQACDIYVHTSRLVNWKFEGFGIVYLEASACGKPIIASDAGGIRDAVLDGQTGLIVSPDNPAETAKAIEKLLDDRELAFRLGQNGMKYAAENDWSVIGQKFLNLYEELI